MQGLGCMRRQVCVCVWEGWWWGASTVRDEERFTEHRVRVGMNHLVCPGLRCFLGGWIPALALSQVGPRRRSG